MAAREEGHPVLSSRDGEGTSRRWRKRRGCGKGEDEKTELWEAADGAGSAEIVLPRRPRLSDLATGAAAAAVGAE
ncbi:hypothetical protein MRX96_004468 [Rhipicephalus microplus]